MRRLAAIGIILGISMAACGKAPDSGARAREDSADSKRGAAVSLLPDTTGAREKGVTPTETPAADTASDVTGGYFPVEAWPAPFADLDFIGLATIDDQGNPAPLNGFIRPRRQSAKDYHLIDPRITGDAFTFSTESIAGVSYSFTGTFVRRGNFPANPPTDVVLKGTLTKMKNGATVAETPVDFTYSAGG